MLPPRISTFNIPGDVDTTAVVDLVEVGDVDVENGVEYCDFVE